MKTQDDKPRPEGEINESPFLSLNKKDPYNLGNISVLIIEDSIYLKNLMVSMLKVFGVGDIMSCNGAEEAKDLLTISLAKKASKYVTDVDIVLTDWIMPEGSGEDLLRWIRGHANDDIRFLPVIVISAYTTERVTVAARDLGANETLVKPVSGKALAQRICSVIDKPRSFIKAPDYFGPDRRRQNLPYEGPNKRSD